MGKNIGKQNRGKQRKTGENRGKEGKQTNTGENDEGKQRKTGGIGKQGKTEKNIGKQQKTQENR